MNALKELWTKYKDQNINTIILETKDRKAIGSISLKECNFDNFIFCELQNQPEKYCIRINGITIYFSYFCILN